MISFRQLQMVNRCQRANFLLLTSGYTLDSSEAWLQIFVFRIWWLPQICRQMRTILMEWLNNFSIKKYWKCSSRKYQERSLFLSLQSLNFYSCWYTAYCRLFNSENTDFHFNKSSKEVFESIRFYSNAVKYWPKNNCWNVKFLCPTMNFWPFFFAVYELTYWLSNIACNINLVHCFKKILWSYVTVAIFLS